MQYFFTSDEHYGHKNMIKFLNRPFSSVEEMTEVMIEKHNKKVNKGDLTFHLGDIFWPTQWTVEQSLAVMKRLNGQHILIWGNHDQLTKNSGELRSKFAKTCDLYKVKYGSPKTPKIVLCHYSMRIWDGSHRGDWHLYGHSHGQDEPGLGLSFDIGVDCHNFEPLSLDEVQQIMSKKTQHHVVKKTWPGKEHFNTDHLPEGSH